MWSDVETGLLQPRANDSRTQLSLDYPMIENYGFVLSEPSGGAAPGMAIPGWVNPLLAQCTPDSLEHSCTNTGLLVDHAGTGEWAGGTSANSDGGRAGKPMSREPRRQRRFSSGAATPREVHERQESHI